MGRKKNEQGSNIVAFRVTDEVLAILDGIVADVNAAASGMAVTRSVMARVLFMRGMAAKADERKASDKRGKR